MKDHTNVWILILVIVIALICAGFSIKGAADCAAKGGTYITGQHTVPACVKEIK